MSDILTAPAESEETLAGRPEVGGRHGSGSTFIRATTRAALLGAILFAATAKTDAAPTPSLASEAPDQPAPSIPSDEPPFSPMDHADAVALLDDELDDTVPECVSPAVMLALRAIAIEREILDPREVRYVLSRPEDLAADLTMLRRRMAELGDAPPLGDSLRFPERSAISDMLAFNRAYRQNMEARLGVERVRPWELEEAIAEADQLYQVWDLIRDSRCDYYYITVRRQALQRLRSMIGTQAYASGDLPPYVPLSRFQRID